MPHPEDEDDDITQYEFDCIDSEDIQALRILPTCDSPFQGSQSSNSDILSIPEDLVNNLPSKPLQFKTCKRGLTGLPYDLKNKTISSSSIFCLAVPSFDE